MKNPKLQSTIITTLTDLDNRKMFQKDFMEVCTGANIVLEKVSKMTNFLQKYCPSGRGKLDYSEESERQLYFFGCE